MKWLIIITLIFSLKNVQNYLVSPDTSAIRIQVSEDNNNRRILTIQNLEHFDSSVFNGTKLRVILTRNKMPSLYEGAFRNMENLQVLQIPSCSIQEIQPTAFWNLRNLDRLQLQDNQITKIENGVFNGMNISQLFLHRNKINYIHREAFDNMLHLHTIKLNANHIKSWDQNWFFNTPKLTNIFMRRNYISELQEDIFKNIKKLHVGHSTVVNSTNIYLSSNNISILHPKALSELVRLNDFFLDRNNISEIPENFFVEIEKVNHLNLYKNKIRRIPKNLFPKISNFGILDLSKNELECIPVELTSQVNKILLTENLITCECTDELSLYNGGGNAKNTSLIIGKCVSDEDGDERGNEEDEDIEEDKEE